MDAIRRDIDLLVSLIKVYESNRIMGPKWITLCAARISFSLCRIKEACRRVGVHLVFFRWCGPRDFTPISLISARESPPGACESISLSRFASRRVGGAFNSPSVVARCSQHSCGTRPVRSAKPSLNYKATSTILLTTLTISEPSRLHVAATTTFNFHKIHLRSFFFF